MIGKGLVYGVGDDPRRDETDVEGVADNVCAISCHGEGCRAMLSASCGSGRKGVVGDEDSRNRSLVMATGDISICLVWTRTRCCAGYCIGIAFGVGRVSRSS